jgi:hypothetical protein
MPVCDFGAVASSWSLLIRGPNLARRQAEIPLSALCKFPKPPLIAIVLPPNVCAAWKRARENINVKSLELASKTANHKRTANYNRRHLLQSRQMPGAFCLGVIAATGRLCLAQRKRNLS